MENSFKHLKSLVDLLVKVNLGGPESRVGKLLDVRSDYLVLETEEDGVLYYQLRHIKSVTKFSKKTSRDTNRTRYYKYDNFIDVLYRLKFKWVKINRGGPQSVEGVISHIKDDNILLIVNDEIVYIPIYHVQNINHPNDNSSKKSKGKQRSSGKNTGGRNSGKRRSRKNKNHHHHDDKCDEVQEAYEQAHKESVAHFMYKDPEEESNHSSGRSGRSIGSGCSRGSHRFRGSSRSIGSRRSWRSHRSIGSKCSSRSHRSRHSGRSIGSRRSMRSHPHSVHSKVTRGVNDTSKIWFNHKPS